MHNDRSLKVVLLQLFGGLILVVPIGLAVLILLFISDLGPWWKTVLIGGIGLFWALVSVALVGSIFDSLRDLLRGPTKLEGFIVDIFTEETRHEDNYDSDTVRSGYRIRVADHSYEESPRFHNSDIQDVHEARSVYDAYELDWVGREGLHDF